MGRRLMVWRLKSIFYFPQPIREKDFPWIQYELIPKETRLGVTCFKMYGDVSVSFRYSPSPQGARQLKLPFDVQINSGALSRCREKQRHYLPILFTKLLLFTIMPPRLRSWQKRNDGLIFLLVLLKVFRNKVFVEVFQRQLFLLWWHAFSRAW